VERNVRNVTIKQFAVRTWQSATLNLKLYNEIGC